MYSISLLSWWLEEEAEEGIADTRNDKSRTVRMEGMASIGFFASAFFLNSVMMMMMMTMR